MSKPEQILREQVTQYLKLQYPEVIYKVDLESDIRLTIVQGARNKKLQYGRGWPDLFIAQPRGSFSGLFVELKATSIYLKDGKTLKQDPHLKEQQAMLNNLVKRGYCAQFAVGFSQAKRLIDAYLR